MFDQRRLTAVGRVAASMTAILAVGVIALSAVSYTALLRSASSDLDSSLLREVEAYTAAIAPVGTTDERSLAEVSRSYLEGRVVAQGAIAPILTVNFASGRVISNSDIPLETAIDNEPLLNPEVAAAGFDTIMFDGEEYRVAGSPILDAVGEPMAVFQAALPLETVQSLARELAIALSVSGLLVIIAGAAGSVWVARRSLTPLREMAASASSVGRPDLSSRIPYDGPPDELGVLADSLNEMLDRLEASFTEQKRFIADASHELRTPIAVVRGNVDLIRHPSTTEEEQSECLAVIDDEVRRMTRMLEDLMALARLQAGTTRKFQPVDLSTLLDEIAARLSMLGETDIVRHCAQGVWVMGDPDLLEQALVNLARNAMTAAGENGTVDTACRADGSIAIVTITDDGPGIPEDAISRIFDRFYRAGEQRSEQGGGSGLGLSITKGLVELHGGSVQAANVDEGGAEFTIHLPRIDAPTE